MDLRLLEYFLAVARIGNITRAAEQLHVTQPTISRQLTELEEMLGTTLLIRGKRQVTLTDAGVLFQQRAEEMLNLMEKTRRDLLDQKDLVGGVVALGCVESCVSRMLPEVLGAFSGLYPKVQYELYSADGDDIREKLDRGELDFGILLEPVEAAKYDFIRLPYWETWGIVLRKDDPLARKESLSREDVLALPLILPRREIVQDNIAGWFGVERSQMHIFAGHNLINNAALLAEAGLGYPVYPGRGEAVLPAFCAPAYHRPCAGLEEEPDLSPGGRAVLRLYPADESGFMMSPEHDTSSGIGIGHFTESLVQ